MKKLNLSEILEDNLPDSMSRILDATTDSKVYIRSAMMEFGKQLLELAAENAEMYYVNRDKKISQLSNFDKNIYRIDSQSITNTLNQVEL